MSSGRFIPNTYYVSNSSGSLVHLSTLIDTAFRRSDALAREYINLEAVEVLFVDAPDEALLEWGVGGTTWSPHVVIVAVDPSFDISEEHVVHTLVHEFHHAMRWRGPGCGGNLAQMLVSEGLAQLFEEEVLGQAPFFAFTEFTADHETEATASLFDPSFSPSKWFFGAEGIPRSFGYAYGYQRCKAYAQAVGRKASELVATPSRQVLGAEEPTR